MKMLRHALSEGTPAMDLGHMHVVLKIGMCVKWCM